MIDEKELTERDSKRDLGAELLESVRQMRAGQKCSGQVKPDTLLSAFSPCFIFKFDRCLVTNRCMQPP